jgi:splicing factor 3A subunit 3
MILEDQRYIHEDLERLEQGIADRIGDEPKHVSNSSQDVISSLLTSIHIDTRPIK